MPKSKHLTDVERVEIEHQLKQRSSFKQIARRLDKHHSTIAREVRSRRTPSDKGAFGKIKNRCLLRGSSCDRRQLCIDKPDCTRRCSTCHRCNAVCPDFSEEVCQKLASAPYVCNGCPEESKCTLRKQYYLAKKADGDYRQILVQSREGANISEGELLELDELVSPLIRKGQSVHHIIVNNPDEFNINQKTLYRYIAGGMLHAKNGDMPRVCMLKPRRRKPVEHKVDTKCRIGRTYADYLQFTSAAPGLQVVEMDSVIGRIGGKVLLTLMFRNGLMLAFLRERNTSHSVIDVFSHLWELAGEGLFRRLFPCLLTDNGSEFSNPIALETAPDGTRRTHLFYCDPCASWQKGRVERNHEFLRLVLPKGSSFDHLTQDHIDTVLSHVNSYSRPGLNDKTPFELFEFTYGSNILKALGIRRIPANDITLKPSLLG